MANQLPPPPPMAPPMGPPMGPQMGPPMAPHMGPPMGPPMGLPMGPPMDGTSLPPGVSFDGPSPWGMLPPPPQSQHRPQPHFQPEWPKTLRERPLVNDKPAPVYEVYSIRRATPEMGGNSTWKTTDVSKIRASSDELLAQHKQSKNRRPVIEQYEGLASNTMREAIDRVIEDRNLNEDNEFLEWQMADIRPYRRRIPGNYVYRQQVETLSIKLLLKRVAKIHRDEYHSRSRQHYPVQPQDMMPPVFRPEHHPQFLLPPPQYPQMQPQMQPPMQPPMQHPVQHPMPPPMPPQVQPTLHPQQAPKPPQGGGPPPQGGGPPPPKPAPQAKPPGPPPPPPGGPPPPGSQPNAPAGGGGGAAAAPKAQKPAAGQPSAAGPPPGAKAPLHPPPLPQPPVVPLEQVLKFLKGQKSNSSDSSSSSSDSDSDSDFAHLAGKGKKGKAANASGKTKKKTTRQLTPPPPMMRGALRRPTSPHVSVSQSRAKQTRSQHKPADRRKAGYASSSEESSLFRRRRNSDESLFSDETPPTVYSSDDYKQRRPSQQHRLPSRPASRARHGGPVGPVKPVATTPYSHSSYPSHPQSENNTIFEEEYRRRSLVPKHSASPPSPDLFAGGPVQRPPHVVEYHYKNELPYPAADDYIPARGTHRPAHPHPDYLHHHGHHGAPPPKALPQRPAPYYAADTDAYLGPRGSGYAPDADAYGVHAAPAMSDYSSSGAGGGAGGEYHAARMRQQNAAAVEHMRQTERRAYQAGLQDAAAAGRGADRGQHTQRWVGEQQRSGRGGDLEAERADVQRRISELRAEERRAHDAGARAAGRRDGRGYC